MIMDPEPGTDAGASLGIELSLSALDAAPKIAKHVTTTLLEQPAELSPGDAPTVHFDIFTLFPQMFGRDYTTDRHHVCDDLPYGGGGGMVMKPEPIFRAVESVLTRPAGWALAPEDAYVALPPWEADSPAALPVDVPIILLTPAGRPFTQQVAVELSRHRRLALICGRYEGFDERVNTGLATDAISIGDYVLSGGELAAMILVDAVTRLLPGALGFELGAHQDSHSAGLGGLLEGPNYTRPPLFRGQVIPPTLLSGHHANIVRWRREQSLLRTLQMRPEMLATAELSKADRRFLQSHGWPPAAT